MTDAIRDQLEAGLIRAGMSSANLSKLRQLTLLQETDSTNTEVSRLPGDRQHAHAVLADRQTGGRGRRQRNWHSPPGGNIYLSLGWWFRMNDWPLSTLPLVVADDPPLVDIHFESLAAYDLRRQRQKRLQRAEQ